MSTRVGSDITRSSVLGPACPAPGLTQGDKETIVQGVQENYNSDFTGKIVTDFSAQKLRFTWYTDE